MKPVSIGRFELWFLLSVVLSLLSTGLGWANLAEQADAAVLTQTGANTRGMGFVLLLSSVAMFCVLALVFWAAIVLSRLGAARYVLALLVAYAGYSTISALLAGKPNAAMIADLVSVVAAVVALAYLFRADARAWFAGDNKTPVDPL